MRSRTRVAGGAVACLLGAVLPFASAGPPPVPALTGCVRTVVSPSFNADGTAFCEARRLTASGTQITIYETTDRARSWRPLQPSGLPAVQSDVEDFLISPDFADDHLLVLEYYGGTVAYSSDAGATFRQAPPLPFGRLTMLPSPASAVPLSPPSGVVPVRHAQILSATSLNSPGTNGSFIFDPIVPDFRLVGGTTDEDEAFFPSPTFASDQVAYAVGMNAGPTGKLEAELFTCTAAFTCAQKVHTFPESQEWLDQFVYAPDYATSKTIAVTLSGLATNHYQVLVSHDGGLHFSAPPTLQQSLQRFYAAGGVGVVSVAAGPTGSHSLYVYLTGGDPNKRSSPPAAQLYRSSDDGNTWRLIAYNRCQCPAGGSGQLPYGAVYSSSAGDVTPPGLLTVAGNRLLMTAWWWPTNRLGTHTVWCSDNQGVTWNVPCR